MFSHLDDSDPLCNASRGSPLAPLGVSGRVHRLTAHTVGHGYRTWAWLDAGGGRGTRKVAMYVHPAMTRHTYQAWKTHIKPGSQYDAIDVMQP